MRGHRAAASTTLETAPSDIVDCTAQQHAFVGQAAANIDLVTAGSMPDLDPLIRDPVQVVDAHAAAALHAAPPFDEYTAAFLTRYRIFADERSFPVMNVPLADPEVEFTKLLVLFAR